jgi:hypothetical protein
LDVLAAAPAVTVAPAAVGAASAKLEFGKIITIAINPAPKVEKYLFMVSPINDLPWRVAPSLMNGV